jgi:probable rRNA maturation factor
MSQELCLRNRQRTRSIDLRLLRQILLALLKDLAPARSFELGIHLVSAAEITRLNETFLHHAGATDVITFNYSSRRTPEALHGDIFVCTSETVAQARRFRTTWQAELARYLVHGILHLQGHEDLHSAARRKMKREENRLLRGLARRFVFQQLGKKPPAARHASRSAGKPA